MIAAFLSGLLVSPATVPDEVQYGVDGGHVGRGPGAAHVLGLLRHPGFDGDHQDDT